MRRKTLLCGLAALVLVAVATPGRAAETLQPYQMVRSLQLVQDRIAAGDHAALPMQAKLLEMIDARLRSATPETFGEPKNFRALLVYGMSGGNPVTVQATASRLELEPHDQAIADGIVAYLNGQPNAAIAALDSVDPRQLPADLGAFVALVKGSLLAAERPVEALALLDQARLLSPGTLVEEAALRRSVAIDARQADAARFALASTQYVGRYLYSPYASQFADTFVSGVIAMHGAMSQDKLADITAMMDAEREKVIYLRIARRAAIDGFADLSAFASAKAEQGRDGKANDDDPRVQLYASLSTVTSATVDTVREKLKTIDRDQLSENDRSLLDAARAVVREMVATPTPAGSVPAAAPTETDAPGEQTSVETDLPPVEGIVGDVPVAPVPVPVATAETKDAAVAADPTDKAIAATRHTLDSIDQMLGVSPQ